MWRLVCMVLPFSALWPGVHGAANYGRSVAVHRCALILQILQFKNFKTAASFAHRLLKLGPNFEVAEQVRGDRAEGMGLMVW